MGQSKKNEKEYIEQNKIKQNEINQCKDKKKLKGKNRKKESYKTKEGSKKLLEKRKKLSPCYESGNHVYQFVEKKNEYVAK